MRLCVVHLVLDDEGKAWQSPFFRYRTQRQFDEDCQALDELYPFATNICYGDFHFEVLAYNKAWLYFALESHNSHLYPIDEDHRLPKDQERVFAFNVADHRWFEVQADATARQVSVNYKLAPAKDSIWLDAIL